MDANGHGLCVLARPLPSSFEARLVTVPPGRSRLYRAVEWRDAIVVVARGEIELEFLDGSSRRFARGCVLWLAGLALRAVWNRGRSRAVLIAVSRRTLDTHGS